MKARNGSLRKAATDRLPLYIKPQPTVFDGTYYSIGFHGAQGWA